MYRTGWSVVITVKSFIVLQTSIRLAQCSCTLHSVLSVTFEGSQTLSDPRLEVEKVPMWNLVPFSLSLLLFCSFFFSPFASWRSRAQVQLGVCGSTVTVSPSAGPGKPGRQTVSRVHSGLKMTLSVIALLHKLSASHAYIAIRLPAPATYGYGVSQKRNGGMVSSQPRKCWYGTSHTVPLPALVRPDVGCSAVRSDAAALWGYLMFAQQQRKYLD